MFNIKRINKIRQCYNESRECGRNPIVMVGLIVAFHHILKIKELLSKMNQPKSVVMTINAGSAR